MTVARTAPSEPATRYRIESRQEGFVVMRCTYHDGLWWRDLSTQRLFTSYQRAVAWVRERQAGEGR